MNTNSLLECFSIINEQGINDLMDAVLTIVNVILVFVSGVGAWKSIKYYKKNKELMIYTQTADVIEEVNEMLSILLRALEIANQKVNKRGRGTNYNKELLNCGKELIVHYQEIEKSIPTRYYSDLNEMLNRDGFHFVKYLNSYISGEAMKEKGLDHDDYAKCQERLYELQRFLRGERDNIEEKLK